MRKHVLLIDDDEDEPEIFSEALKKMPEPIDCYTVASPEHALKVLNDFVPHFIFVDYNMPKMNGVEFISEIRKIKKLATVPLILYSNNLDKDVVAEAMSLGATACIKKPDKTSILVDKLKDILFKDGQNGLDH